ncbi:MAG: response regulator [Deltaproteobacteria bacterium]|nr:response regulator [Deltaproteobacteria bacterium]
MATINSQHALEELLFNIKEQDSIKAKLVLEHLADFAPAIQKRMLFELSRSDARFSVPLLAFLLHRHPSLAASYPTVREVLKSRVVDDPDLLLARLRQPLPEVTVFLELAAELRLAAAVPAISRLLTTTTEVPVLTAAIIALGEIGVPSAVGAVREFLYADTRELVMAAVTALGRLASPAALQALAARMGGDAELDALVLEIMARVRNRYALEQLNKTLSSPAAFLRNRAKKHLAALGVRAVPVLLANLASEDQDLVIHTLNILGEIGAAEAVEPIRKLLHRQPEDANVRFAAYEALGMLPLAKGAYALAAGLQDPDANVRMAAARAVDRSFNEILAVGLQNMLAGGGEEAASLCRTVIDAHADRIVRNLVKEEVFRQAAVAYLAARAPAATREHYLSLFRREGVPELAALVEEKTAGAAAAARPRPLACAVDDSRMILKIYRSILHELGFEPVLFEFPAAALEWLAGEKPAVLLTDLNMPEITGIELISRVREKYARPELPIIMVTTQNEMAVYRREPGRGLGTASGPGSFSPLRQRGQLPVKKNRGFCDGSRKEFPARPGRAGGIDEQDQS